MTTTLARRHPTPSSFGLEIADSRTQRQIDRDPTATQAEVERRERCFATIRLWRSVAAVANPDSGAVVAFPTAVVVDGVAFDLVLTAQPGWFSEGHHTVVAQGRVGDVDVLGRFEVSVGGTHGVAPATWSFVDVATRLHRTQVPFEVGLPRSVQVAVGSPRVALQRARHAAERARAELLEANRGLVRSVVNRFRGVVRSEPSLVDLRDLMVVSERALLDVADRWFTDPDERPLRTVAWSKLVQRNIGNALRSEIARATGISVEFRQLLSWFHAHPADRDLPVADLARRMAFAAGVTRLMSLRGIHVRQVATAMLEGMLATGEAAYVEPGPAAAATGRRLRSAGVFVISPRSSLAEIERARRYEASVTTALDHGQDHHDRNDVLGIEDHGFDRADVADAVRSVIEQSGMTAVEASVWLLRTGVLHQSGHTLELADIADELGLADRAEARAALRRAWRKLDNWAQHGATFF